MHNWYDGRWHTHFINFLYFYILVYKAILAWVELYVKQLLPPEMWWWSITLNAMIDNNIWVGEWRRITVRFLDYLLRLINDHLVLWAIVNETVGSSNTLCLHLIPTNHHLIRHTILGLRHLEIHIFGWGEIGKSGIVNVLRIEWLVNLVLNRLHGKFGRHLLRLLARQNIVGKRANLLNRRFYLNSLICLLDLFFLSSTLHVAILVCFSLLLKSRCLFKMLILWLHCYFLSYQWIRNFDDLVIHVCFVGNCQFYCYYCTNVIKCNLKQIIIKMITTNIIIVKKSINELILL